MVEDNTPQTAGYYGANYICCACGSLYYGYIDLTDDEARYCPDCLRGDEDEDGTLYGHCEDCYEWVMVEYIDNRGYRVNVSTSPLYCEDCAALHAKYYREYLEKLRRSPQHGFVYLLDSQIGVWKIGRSGVPVKRISKLEVVLPYDLEVVALIESANMYYTEGYLHNKYADKRVKGEWFALNRDDVEYIKSQVGVPAWRRRLEQMIAEEDALWR